jgi:CHAT domain-containing protein
VAAFDKIVPELEGRTHIFLAPDGEFSLLPFEALPAPGGHLLDSYRMNYLSCGRDLLRFGQDSGQRPTASVIVADPAFNLAADSSTSPAPVGPATPAIESRRSADLDRGIRFGPLRNTREEGEQIASMLGVKAWLGSEVLESRLKEVRSPQVLHLATHGFFLRDVPPAWGPNPPRPAWAASLEPARLSGPGMENPMLRSGLALAGANVWLAGGRVHPEAEDGLLTAEDVTTLQLSATELVVLSACETGLGEVRCGEGVFGLRRSFCLAGVRTLVMSLWKVPDAQTKELMLHFYHRLLTGEAIGEALRGARLVIRTVHGDPYFWGAFVCQGEATPLSVRAMRSLAE